MVERVHGLTRRSRGTAAHPPPVDCRCYRFFIDRAGLRAGFEAVPLARRGVDADGRLVVAIRDSMHPIDPPSTDETTRRRRPRPPTASPGNPRASSCTGTGRVTGEHIK